MRCDEMRKNTNLDKSLCEIGEIIGIKREEIKMTLKHRKNSILLGIVFILALALVGNLNMLIGKRYIVVSPADFNFFNKFPFSFLF
jgi:uncharacterized membrane-anchored protein